MDALMDKVAESTLYSVDAVVAVPMKISEPFPDNHWWAAILYLFFCLSLIECKWCYLILPRRRTAAVWGGESRGNKSREERAERRGQGTAEQEEELMGRETRPYAGLHYSPVITDGVIVCWGGGQGTDLHHALRAHVWRTLRAHVRRTR